MKNRFPFSVSKNLLQKFPKELVSLFTWQIWLEVSSTRPFIHVGKTRGDGVNPVENFT